MDIATNSKPIRESAVAKIFVLSLCAGILSAANAAAPDIDDLIPKSTKQNTETSTQRSIETLGVSGNSSLMSLSQAEMMAMKNDSRSKKANAMKDSLMEKSVAANTWPDPKINMGIVNISANSMDF